MIRPEPEGGDEHFGAGEAFSGREVRPGPQLPDRDRGSRPLPHVEAAFPPASTPVPEVAVLPESGGAALLPVAVIALGIVALSAGGVLRRR